MTTIEANARPRPDLGQLLEPIDAGPPDLAVHFRAEQLHPNRSMVLSFLHLADRHAGISNLRLHDLRRTFGSWLAIKGASLPIVGKALGHKSQAATAIYARLNIDPVRDAAETGTAAGKAAPK